MRNPPNLIPPKYRPLPKHSCPIWLSVHTFILGILAASCAGSCSPCKLYDMQCLCNIPIRFFIWENLSRNSGCTPRCPAVLRLWLSDYALPFFPIYFRIAFSFHMFSAPRVRRLPAPRSGLAEHYRPCRPRSPLPSPPFPVPCDILCNVFFISQRYAASSIPPIICFIHTLQSRLVSSFPCHTLPFSLQIYILSHTSFFLKNKINIISSNRLCSLRVLVRPKSHGNSSCLPSPLKSYADPCDEFPSKRCPTPVITIPTYCSTFDFQFTVINDIPITPCPH